MHAMYAAASVEGDFYAGVPSSGGVVATSVCGCESTSTCAVLVEALHTFTLDSGASRCFFRDCTPVTPLTAPVLVSLVNPSSGPVVAHGTTVLPCPAASSGSLIGFHLPLFATNLVSRAVFQDQLVTTTTPGGKLVAICADLVTSDHLATFTRRFVSGLYRLHIEFAKVAVSGQVAASCSCRLLTHPSLLWHHRLGHPSLQCLRRMHSRLLVSDLPRSLPPLPPSLEPPCTPCVEGRQRAAPHSSSFPPTTAPLQTLHMDVWGPAPVPGLSRERYFLLVVDDYTRYTTVFPLQSKGNIRLVLIPWIRAICCQQSAQSHHPPWWSLWGSPLARLRGGDPDFDDTAASRHSPRLETPPGFLPLPSSPPLLPVAVDSGAAGGGGAGGVGSEGVDAGGSGSRGAEPGAAETGGATPGELTLGVLRVGVGQELPLHPQETPSSHQLREWVVGRRADSAGAGSGGAERGGAATADTEPAVADSGAGGAGGTGAGGAEAAGAGGTGAGGTGAGGSGAGGARGFGARAFFIGLGATSQTAQLSFTLDFGASSCFFRDCTDLTPLHTPVTVALDDPSVGLVVAHSTTTLPCPATPSRFLTCYYTPSFSRNLVFQSCLPRWPAPPCTHCVEGRQCAAPHSSSFPTHHGSCTDPALGRLGPLPGPWPTSGALLLIVVDDYSRYTTVFPLRRKADVPTVLETWLLARGGAQGMCRLRLHSDCGGEFSSTRLEMLPLLVSGGAGGAAAEGEGTRAAGAGGAGSRGVGGVGVETTAVVDTAVSTR
ncbi:unnamed protein product [Closterium sp. NIES-54]